MLKHLSFIALSMYGGQQIIAQDTVSTIVPQSFKIGFLEPSRTVGKGNFMVEGGVSVFHQKLKYAQESYQSSIWSVPKIKLRYGIGKNLEVFVEQNNYFRDYNYAENLHSHMYGAGIKLNVSQQKGWLPNSSISVTQQYFNSDWGEGYRTQANLAWDYDLGRRFNLAGNIIYAWANPDFYELGLGLKLTYKMNSKLNLYMDWYAAELAYDFSVLNIGASYQISPRCVVFANAGTNQWVVNERYSGGSFNANIGVSFLLNNPNKKKRGKKRR